MGRRKRASMREGPLADLFRSTTASQEAVGEEAGEHQVEPVEDDPTMEPSANGNGAAGHDEIPEPEELNVYRVEDEADAEKPVDEVEAVEAAVEPVEETEDAVETEENTEDDVEETEEGGRNGLQHIFAGEESGGGELESPLDEPAYGRTEPHAARSFATPKMRLPVLRVVGVGGAGVNAVNRMVEAQISGVEFLAINTDLQSLQQSTADVTVHIGGEVTRGLGSGSVPDLGHKAAFEDQDKIKRLLKGSDMVFVTAGVGGGTGTGAAPVVARLARAVGALTVGIVTKPFGFEGSRRMKQAEAGADALAEEVDTLIVVPNERLLSILSRSTSVIDAFKVADDVLRQGVQGIADLVTLPAVINLDFADVRTIMREAGPAILGIGMGTGDSRAVFAAERAVSSPLLDSSVDGARSILLSVTGGSDLSLIEVSEAAKVIQEAAHPDANIIFGANIDDELDEQVWVTVIATRFDARGRRADGGSRYSGEHRGMAFERERRTGRRRESGDKPELHAGDLGIEAPEFEPSK